jgi:hypothetical protein
MAEQADKMTSATACAVAPTLPRAFVSYSHDSDEHCDKVLALALQLRRDGIDARLDQFEQSPPQGCRSGVRGSFSIRTMSYSCARRAVATVSSVLKNSAQAVG